MSLDFGTHLAHLAIRKNVCPQSVDRQHAEMAELGDAADSKSVLIIFTTLEITA